MGREIRATKDYVIKIFKELKDNYKENNFQFGQIFIGIKYLFKMIKMNISHWSIKLKNYNLI